MVHAVTTLRRDDLQRNKVKEAERETLKCGHFALGLIAADKFSFILRLSASLFLSFSFSIHPGETCQVIERLLDRADTDIHTRERACDRSS